MGKKHLIYEKFLISFYGNESNILMENNKKNYRKIIYKNYTNENFVFDINKKGNSIDFHNNIHLKENINYNSIKNEINESLYAIKLKIRKQILNDLINKMRKINLKYD